MFDQGGLSPGFASEVSANLPEVGEFGPQMWNIALNPGHWDTRSWTKPLSIRYTCSQICKLCSLLREKQTIGMRKTDAHVKRGCSWSRQKYKALICSK